MSGRPRRRGPAPPRPVGVPGGGAAVAAGPEDWGVDTRVLRLAANADVEVSLGAGRRVVRARRQDAFDLLAARGRLDPDGLAAVRRLQEDLAVMHRTIGGSREFAPRVDSQADPQGFSDARLRAGERVRAALDRAGCATANLLIALCEPGVVLGRSVDWRAVVERATGEGLADAQGALLRMACANLAGAYRALDSERRRQMRGA